MEMIDSHHCHGGEQRRYRHAASSTNCDMVFSVFLPPQAQSQRVPALYWLSGLTCTDENFSTKAGAQRLAAELGLALVMPDTSPRGDGVPDDPDGGWDLGLAAGFYVNATQAPWNQHYRMYDYVVEELPALIETELPVTDRRALSGHSMGGHGALMIALRNPDRYASVSAFAPIVNPTKVPWGNKAFSAYLGADQEIWQPYDTVALILGGAGNNLPLLVDQGDADNWLAEQLTTDQLIDACKQAGREATIRMQPGYDHSYWFIQSFIDDHLRFHAAALAR